jgi:hypothetical protein
MVDLYIYYRVRDEHASILAPRMRAMQAGLLARHGVAGRLLRRPDASDGVQTWMEVYPDAASGFEAALALAVGDADVSAFIDGQRHIEVFTDISTCA